MDKLNGAHLLSNDYDGTNLQSVIAVLNLKIKHIYGDMERLQKHIDKLENKIDKKIDG